MSLIRHISQNPALPMDVIYDIIGELTQPREEDVYALEPVIILTLIWLCRMSRDIHSWSVPHLYRRVTLQNSRDLHRFIKAGIPHAGHVRALLFTIDSRCGAEDVAQVIREVGAGLEKLMLDGGVWHEHPSQILSKVHRTMPCLHDLVYAVMFTRHAHKLPNFLKLCPNLRRLALLGGDVQFNNIFPALESLVLSTPRATPEFINDIISTHTNLRQIRILMSKHYENWPSMTGFHDRKHAVAAAHRHVTILDVYTGMKGPGDYKWAAEHARRDTLWTLPGRDWYLPL